MSWRSLPICLALGCGASPAPRGTFETTFIPGHSHTPSFVRREADGTLLLTTHSWRLKLPPRGPSEWGEMALDGAVVAAVFRDGRWLFAGGGIVASAETFLGPLTRQVVLPDGWTFVTFRGEHLLGLVKGVLMEYDGRVAPLPAQPGAGVTEAYVRDDGLGAAFVPPRAAFFTTDFGASWRRLDLPAQGIKWAEGSIVIDVVDRPYALLARDGKTVPVTESLPVVPPELTADEFQRFADALRAHERRVAGIFPERTRDGRAWLAEGAHLFTLDPATGRVLAVAAQALPDRACEIHGFGATLAALCPGNVVYRRAGDGSFQRLGDLPDRSAAHRFLPDGGGVIYENVGSCGADPDDRALPAVRCRMDPRGAVADDRAPVAEAFPEAQGKSGWWPPFANDPRNALVIMENVEKGNRIAVRTGADRWQASDLPPEASDRFPPNVGFADPLHGVVMGRFVSAFFVTVDGGRSWNRAAPEVSGGGMEDGPFSVACSPDACFTNMGAVVRFRGRTPFVPATMLLGAR